MNTTAEFPRTLFRAGHTIQVLNVPALQSAVADGWTALPELPENTPPQARAVVAQLMEQLRSAIARGDARDVAVGDYQNRQNERIKELLAEVAELKSQFQRYEEIVLCLGKLQRLVGELK